VNDPGAYVVRDTRRAHDGRSTYTLVDMAGRVLHVTVPYNLSATEHLDLVLRHAVASRPAPKTGRS
jgi:phosphate-selective porin